MGFGNWRLFLKLWIASILVVVSFTINGYDSITSRISMGDLDIQQDIKRKDEIRELAEAFERMRASMQIAIERLRTRRS